MVFMTLSQPREDTMHGGSQSFSWAAEKTAGSVDSDLMEEVEISVD